MEVPMTTKDDFLQSWSNEYGYGGRIDAIRATEFARLAGVTYFDSAGTMLYPATTVARHAELLQKHIYGNPHSRHASSERSEWSVDSVRLAVLRELNADPSAFSVVFTANATAALKLCWEMGPWQSGASEFCYLRENHTSVVGLRALAERAGVLTRSVCATDVEQTLAGHKAAASPSNDGLPRKSVATASTPTYSLFVYPAQCNYSGARFPWTWARQVRDKGIGTAEQRWLVAVDASAYASSTPVNMSSTDDAPDFLVISFYKMYGFPTGLAALIVRNSLLPVLQKCYFGGGTVSALTYDDSWQVFRESIYARYEDGTIDFLGIAGLGIAIEEHRRLYGSQQEVARHTHSLFRVLYHDMAKMVHQNGRPVFELYVDHQSVLNQCYQGPVLAFSILRADGEYVGYVEVERLASVHSIQLRTGGFCNPGASQKWLNYTSEDIRQQFEAGHVCWDDKDVIRGRPTGAIRLSLGAMNTYEDVASWLAFVRRYFVQCTSENALYTEFMTYTPKSAGLPSLLRFQGMRVGQLAIFPIKSCRHYSIPPDTLWPITEKGLEYDRTWMLVSVTTQSALTQKRYPQMARICPSICYKTGMLTVSAPDVESLVLPLNTHDDAVSTAQTVRVCGEYTVDTWFSAVIGTPCRLVRQSAPRLCKPSASPMSSGTISDSTTPAVQMSLSNESPFLLVSRSSAEWIFDRIAAQRPQQQQDDAAACIELLSGAFLDVDRFRGNIVVDGAPSFAEDCWYRLRIGTEIFEVMAPCRRCHMVCIDQTTAIKSHEPYATLAKHRRSNGRVLFGQHLKHIPNYQANGPPIPSDSLAATISVGDVIEVLEWSRAPTL